MRCQSQYVRTVISASALLGICGRAHQLPKSPKENFRLDSALDSLALEFLRGILATRNSQ